MNTKDLMHLYEKLIESHSPQNQLFNNRQYTSLLNNQAFTPQMVARIRFSQEYLSLLTTEKAFNSTFDSLSYLFNKEKGLKHNKRNFSAQYYEWMFEKIFTKGQKQTIEKMVTIQFGGQTNQSPSKSQNQNLPKIDEKENKELNQKQKNLFCQMLQLIFCQDQIVKKRKQNNNKNISQSQTKNRKQKNEADFISVGQILGMIL